MESVSELKDLFDSLTAKLYGDRTLTENSAGAFTTTGDKCLDFFGTVVRSTSIATVIQGFLQAWNEDPDKAVKLLLNLRDIRGGKGEKKLALVLMYTLSYWKPLTYLANLQKFLEVGCYKDLLFISEMAVRCDHIDAFKRIPQMDSQAVELKIMACQLTHDEGDLLANEKAGISLCAKWAPTENTHFDHKPLRFARKITKVMGIKKSEYRHKLSKLRSHINVLEMLMATEKWDQIVFKSLPAKAHRLNRSAFHGEENAKKVKSDDRVKLALRYKEYLEKLTKGKTTIKSTGIQPHELILPYMNNASNGVDLTLEGQWNDLIAKLAATGKFANVQAVCDVSGSMFGIPMQVAIALGLVVAELTDEPFKNQLITFHESPSLHTVRGTTLRERVADVQGMSWGGSTDLIKVFQLLLDRAKANPGAKMVEKLFIFSDMQFNQAVGRGYGGYRYLYGGFGQDHSAGGWETTYDTICKMFGKTPFAVPQIVFWNLRDTHASFPVKKDEVGTALMSGFSAQMLKVFLQGETAEFSPVAIMNDVLDKYEIAEVPKEERYPLEADVAAFEQVATVVEQFLVAKKVPNKKRGTSLRGGRGLSRPRFVVRRHTRPAVKPSRCDSSDSEQDTAEMLEEEFHRGHRV